MIPQRAASLGFAVLDLDPALGLGRRDMADRDVSTPGSPGQIRKPRGKKWAASRLAKSFLHVARAGVGNSL